MRLEGKVAIVTGAGRGIGFAYAERFLREGASVVVAEVDADTGKHAAAALSEVGPAEFVHTDVTSPESVHACVQAAVDRFGGLHVLVNNAALYGDWDMGDQSFDYLKQVVDVNQHSVWLMSHAAAPAMVDGGGGRIINQASGAAYNYVSPFRPDEFNGMGTFNYQIAKWGVVGLTKFMAGALGTWNITVNCIAPGVIDTEATRRAVPAGTIEMLAKQQAVPGVLNAEDLTGAAVYFASDEARFVTGQVLVIDGGRHMPA
jgi:NAD(P)-dependent dehydrogenase (short-subunit alcohol dehydrogenase family)